MLGFTAASLFAGAVVSTHSFPSIGIQFIRISRLKEYFKNKPEAEILKRKQFRELETCEYNKIMFLTKPYKTQHRSFVSGEKYSNKVKNRTSNSTLWEHCFTGICQKFFCVQNLDKQ